MVTMVIWLSSICFILSIDHMYTWNTTINVDVYKLIAYTKENTQSKPIVIKYLAHKLSTTPPPTKCGWRAGKSSQKQGYYNQAI